MAREQTQVPAMRLGLDIDGTITRDPLRFAEIARSCMAAGGQVHIVTSRSEASRSPTLDELRGYRVPFTAIHFLGEMSRAADACPHKSLDWFERYLWQKVAYATQHGLTHFIDDDSKVLSLFARFAPEVVAISAGDDRIYREPPAIDEIFSGQRTAVAGGVDD